MEQLKSMEEMLMSVVQGQMSHLDSVDTKELGEAIDMIKDLEEAIYYCTITESMKKKEHEEDPKYYRPYRDVDREMGRMYYPNGGSEHGTHNGSSDRNYGGGYGTVKSYTEREYPTITRDYREGRSPINRKMYMESKEMHKDKSIQLKELETYMQELTHDITEMIEGASPEEKEILQQKISHLASKIH